MNKKIKIIIGVVALVALVIGIFLGFNLGTETIEVTPEVTLEDRELTLHVRTSSWKPYMYEEEGEYTGIAVDLLDLVMTRLDVNYEFELVPWSRALKLAEVGDADALLAAGYSPERESFIEFTPEQLTYGVEDISPTSYLLFTDGAFFVRTESKDSFPFESIEQISSAGYRIGVNQGYRYHADIADADWNKISHVTEQNSFEALMNREIDLFLTYKEVGLAIRDELGLQNEVSLVAGDPPFRVYYFILFSKNSDYPGIDNLQNRVDEELLKIHESGEYDEIYNSYIE